MPIPTFRYMGGKARLRNWLISYFPPSGDWYVEPFAGLGNVFFLAKSLNYKKWWLNDINARFLKAMLTANLDDLPTKVNKTDFLNWRNRDDDLAKLVEPRITYGGKGYQAGFSGSSGSHKGYDGVLYRDKCEAARELLQDVKITEGSWKKMGIQRLSPNSFMYCDPPYYGTNTPYPNIEHEDFVQALNQCKCKWAVSGYSNELYDVELNFINRYTKERNSEIKGSNSQGYQPVTEVLWTNY